jgi:hypothetical protein
MRCLPEHYFAAALERYTEAGALRRQARWALAMYVAGLAAECMVRAWIPAGTQFDERHDLYQLLKVTEWPLSAKQRRALHSALEDVRSLWHNSLRFADEGRVRAHLRQLHLDRGPEVAKNADFLKVRCEELERRVTVVVDCGRSAWKR